MEDEIPFGIFRPEKQVYFFRKRLAPITFQPDFPETFGKSDKQSAFVESVYVHICYSERTLWTMMLNALVGLRNGMDS